MPAPDTNPVFWRQLEQLGHAVVIQAVQDYASARKMQMRKKRPSGSDHWNPLCEMGYYERFFRSKYFGFICPKYDGHELFDILKSGGWMKLKRMHHYAKPPTYVVDTNEKYRMKMRAKREGNNV